MTLQRYNDIIWAVVGTLALLGAISAVVAFVGFKFIFRHEKSPTIVIGKPNQPKVNQDLVFCEPIVVPGTQRQLLPVAAVNVDDPTSEKTVVMQYEAALSRGEGYYDPSRCTLGSYTSRTRIFNV